MIKSRYGHVINEIKSLTTGSDTPLEIVEDSSPSLESDPINVNTLISIWLFLALFVVLIGFYFAYSNTSLKIVNDLAEQFEIPCNSFTINLLQKCKFVKYQKSITDHFWAGFWEKVDQLADQFDIPCNTFTINLLKKCNIKKYTGAVNQYFWSNVNRLADKFNFPCNSITNNMLQRCKRFSFVNYIWK